MPASRFDCVGIPWPIRIIALFCIVAVFGGCGNDDASESAKNAPDLAGTADSMTVPRVLQTDDRFSTLVAALDSAGLNTTLAGTGPYTLFAPPNAAFEELPNGTVDILLTERTGRLRTILAHHVVADRVEAAQLADTTALITLSGDSLRVRSDTVLTVGTAAVVDDDIPVANGLIHVIDRVVPPPSDDTN